MKNEKRKMKMNKHHIFITTSLLFFLYTTCYAENPADSKKIFQIEHIAPVSFTKIPDGTYFIDFGKDAFGTLELTYKAKESGTMLICLGEKLSNGKIDTNPGGSIRYAEVKLQVTPSQENYTLKLTANKRNTSGAAVLLPDSFGVVMPFRYVEIKNAVQPVNAADVRQKAYFHSFDDSRSDFNCSDSILVQVWKLCKYSMKATSFTGLYIDGDRERIPYEADAYINMLGHFCTDCEYDIAERTIEHFMSHPTWPTEWQLHVALLMYQDYYYSGDPGLLKKYYNQLKYKTLMELAREDGLISTTTGKVTDHFMQELGFTDTKQRIRDLVDWPPGQKDTGWKLSKPEGERDGYDMVAVNTMVNCFFFENMKIMAEIAGVLGQNDDKVHFEQMAAKVKTSINQKLFNAEKGIYLDGEGSAHSSLHANMTALAFGIVPPQYIKSVTSFVKSRGMACSVYGSQYLLEGLYRYNEGQYALDLMRSTSDRSWWNMIRSGSTITMEAWDMKYKPNSDWNHAWGATPANIIPRCLWGIRPDVPGYLVAGIHPQMGNLKFCTIKTPTIHGPIKAEYRWISNKLKTYSIDIPANVTGEFTVVHARDEVVLLNGKNTDLSIPFIKLKSGNNKIEIKRK
jgi:alpha-L-rhamnosidase